MSHLFTLPCIIRIITGSCEGTEAPSKLGAEDATVKHSNKIE